MDISITSRREWTAVITRGPGDEWADCPKRYSSQTLRPERLHVSFAQEQGGEIHLGAATVSGPRLLSGGRFGAQISEKWYGLRDMPEWAREAVKAALRQIEKEG